MVSQRRCGALIAALALLLVGAATAHADENFGSASPPSSSASAGTFSASATGTGWGCPDYAAIAGYFNSYALGNCHLGAFIEEGATPDPFNVPWILGNFPIGTCGWVKPSDVALNGGSGAPTGCSSPSARANASFIADNFGVCSTCYWIWQRDVNNGQDGYWMHTTANGCHEWANIRPWTTGGTFSGDVGLAPNTTDSEQIGLRYKTKYNYADPAEGTGISRKWYLVQDHRRTNLTTVPMGGPPVGQPNSMPGPRWVFISGRCINPPVAPNRAQPMIIPGT